MQVNKVKAKPKKKPLKIYKCKLGLISVHSCKKIKLKKEKQAETQLAEFSHIQAEISLYTLLRYRSKGPIQWWGALGKTFA